MARWASNCNHETANDVADAVVNLGQDIRELGFADKARTAVKRLDRLHERDPTGDLVNLCDLPEVRIICRWLLHVLEGANAADIATRIEQLPPSVDFARSTEPASFEIMHAPQLNRTDELEFKESDERSRKWKHLANRFRAVLSNHDGDDHPDSEIKEICVEGAILASQISQDGNSWLPAPPRYGNIGNHRSPTIGHLGVKSGKSACAKSSLPIHFLKNCWPVCTRTIRGNTELLLATRIGGQEYGDWPTSVIGRRKNHKRQENNASSITP